jgi:hypothetical protein
LAAKPAHRPPVLANLTPQAYALIAVIRDRAGLGPRLTKSRLEMARWIDFGSLNQRTGRGRARVGGHIHVQVVKTARERDSYHVVIQLGASAVRG